MAKSSGSKKKTLAYWLIHKETGHHYVLRLGREAYDKLKDEKIKRYNPVLKGHVEYVIRKAPKAK
jgi:hypothetical protein